MQKPTPVQIATIAAKNFNKLFCIGYNKTGTSTMFEVFKRYGYRTAPQQIQEVMIAQRSFATDYRAFSSFVDQYDAFQDKPFSQGQVFVAADALFPDSRFILTERDPEDWFRSLLGFTRKIFPDADKTDDFSPAVIEASMGYLYPGNQTNNLKRILSEFEGRDRKVNWAKMRDPEFWIDMYLRRNAEIKRYFMRAPEKLLVIDVTRAETTAEISTFLDLPDDTIIGMPHANRT